MRRVLLGMAMLLAMAGVAGAQTDPGCGAASGTVHINPTAYCFESPYWADTNLGQPVITGAKIFVYAQTTGTNGPVVATVDIGHPTAQPNKTADSYYVVKGAWSRPVGVQADGVTQYVALIEEQVNGGGTRRSALGDPFAYSRVLSLPVRPPIISRASPLRSPGLAPCIEANRFASLFASRGHSAVIESSSPKSMRSAMGRAGGWSGRPRRETQEPAAT